MSTPPPNYPPPGQGYYGAPPPQQNSGGGCLKAAGITCGVLVLLMIIGGILTVNWVKNQAKNPNGLFGQSMKVGIAASQGIRIQQAVAQYKSQTGNYPVNLQALVPTYIDGKLLHSDVDTNPSPGHISWQYIRPGADSSPKSAMLILPYSMTISMGGQSKTISSQLIINVDGSTNTNTGQTGGFDQTPSSNNQ